MHPASRFAHSKRKKALLLLLCLVFLACLALLFRSSKTPALFTRRGTSRYCAWCSSLAWLSSFTHRKHCSCVGERPGTTAPPPAQRFCFIRSWTLRPPPPNPPTHPRPCDCATWHESVQEWVHLPQSAQGRRCKMKDNTQPDMHTSSWFAPTLSLPLQLLGPCPKWKQ